MNEEMLKQIIFSYKFIQNYINMESQKIQKSQGRPFHKKSFPSSIILTPNSKYHAENMMVNKPIRFRKTDHTDEINSQLTNSQIHRQNHQKYVQDGGRIQYGLQFRGIKNEPLSLAQIMYQKEERVVELREKLKNIHHFYRIRIQEQRKKNLERSQIFIGIMQELQQIHNEKVSNYNRELSQTQTERQEIGVVDERVEEVKKKIQEVCCQSQELKAANQELKIQIADKKIKIKQKQIYCQSIKSQFEEMRDCIQNFQKQKIRQNRGRKEIIQLIDHIF